MTTPNFATGGPIDPAAAPRFGEDGSIGEPEHEPTSAAMVIGPGGVTPTVDLAGLTLDLPDDLTFEQWEQLGTKITATLRSSRWLIGDWIRYAAHREATWGRSYLDAIDLTGLEPSAVADAVWVAETIPPEQRTGKLSWETHRALAAVDDPTERATQLRLALDGGWTEREARQAARSTNAIDTTAEPADIEEPAPPPRVTVTLRGIPAVHVDTVRTFTKRLVEVLAAEGVDGCESKVVTK